MSDDELKRFWHRVRAASEQLEWDYNDICHFIATVSDLPVARIYAVCIDEE